MGSAIQGLPKPNVDRYFGAAITMTNMGAGLAELGGFRRRTVDLQNYTEFRFHTGIQTAGAAGAVLGVQFSVNAGTNWAGLDNGTDATLSTVTNVLTNTGSLVTAWAAIAAAAKVADCLLRIAGSGGDGAADPVISVLSVEFR